VADDPLTEQERYQLRYLDGVDDRIRDVMDRFYDAPHTCGDDPAKSSRCVACLYTMLNDALRPANEVSHQRDG
jgi:hypothetical protein